MATMIQYVKKDIALRFFTLGALILIGALAYFGAPVRADSQKIAEDIFRSCAGEDTKKCYEEKVPALYPQHSVPELFDIVRTLRRMDTSYQFCHVLAHEIGERVVAENPDRWLDAIPLNPTDGMCSNGYIHGVVGGRFRAEVLDGKTIDSLISDFSRACEARPDWQPSDLDRAICYHGLGHLYDFITDANLTEALSLCARTTTDQFSRVCIEGVFMQIYQPLEPDDFELIKRMPVSPTKETVHSFCASYGEDEFVGACLRESWPFFVSEVQSGSGVEAFCTGHPNEAEEQKCYESATAIIGRMSLSDSERAAAACTTLPEKWQLTCFTTTARAVIEEDRDAGEAAVALCMRGGTQIGSACIETLARQASFVFGQDKERMARFCEEIPDMYRAQCL